MTEAVVSVSPQPTGQCSGQVKRTDHSELLPDTRGLRRPSPAQKVPTTAGPTYHHADPHRGLRPGPEPVREVFRHRAAQERGVRGQAVDELACAGLVKESHLLPQDGGEQGSSQPIHDALPCESEGAGSARGPQSSPLHLQPRRLGCCPVGPWNPRLGPKLPEMTIILP